MAAVIPATAHPVVAAYAEQSPEVHHLKQEPLYPFLARLLLVAAIVPVFMLFYGYFGDDYMFHLSSWMGMVQDWRSGIAFPSWLASANWGLGEPRFFFYPPISMMIGAVLTLLLPLRIVPALYVFLVAIVAGLAMRKLARWLVPGQEDTAALLYCTSYYLIANGVLRYAIAEALIAALLPLLVLAYLQTMTARQGMFSPALAALLAAAWLTNLPAALVIFYVLLFGSGLYAITQRSFSPMIRFAAAEAIAIALSAWYLLPAVLAKSQVAAAGIQAKFPWRAYTLFQHPRNPLARSLTYPLWFWCLGSVALLAVWLIRRWSWAAVGSSQKRKALWLTALLGCIPLLFVVPQGGVLWKHLPQLQLVAFSWRFFPFLCVGLAIVLPLVLTKRAFRGLAFAVWALLMCLPMLERVAHRHAHGGPESFAENLATIQLGTEGFEEYLPAGVTEKVSPGEYEGLVTAPDVQACTLQVEGWRPQEKDLTSSSTGNCSYVLNLFYFPEWHAELDGRQVLPLIASADHRVRLRLPPGDHQVRVVFTRPVKPFLVGLLVTTLAAAFLLGTKRWSVTPHPEDAAAA